jgi:hypothetical protein
MMMRFWVCAALLACSGVSLAAERVAVTVFAGDPAMRRYERAVQARLEEVLRDAGYETLDQKEAEKIKNNWTDNIEPGVLLTAEEFSRRTEKMAINKVYRVSFTAGSSHPMNLFYSASGSVQVSLHGPLATVKSYTSKPMGVLGNAPSDALTEDAAIVNALQRSVESAVEQSGVQVLAPVTARYVPLTLTPLAALPAGAAEMAVNARSAAPGWEKHARLLDEKWRREEPACQATSGDGAMGVQGTYAWQRQMGGAMTVAGTDMSKDGRAGRLGSAGGSSARAYGGYLHLVDLAGAREIAKLTLHELGDRVSGEVGPSSALACSFLGNWRYLIAASGNKIACFDVERGLQTCSHPVTGAPDKASLNFWQAGSKRFVVLATSKAQQVFELTAGPNR